MRVLVLGGAGQVGRLVECELPRDGVDVLVADLDEAGAARVARDFGGPG